jgi:pilus assembly protein CpaF
VRGAEAFELTRAVNAGCGMACTIHANSAPDALDALVNSALMAGENVPERVVRKVFSSSLDLVVHLDRLTTANDEIVRQVSEVRALVPSLHDDFSTEALFVREAPGAPLEWTGSLPPPPLIRRLDRVKGEGWSLAEMMGGPR